MTLATNNWKSIKVASAPAPAAAAAPSPSAQELREAAKRFAVRTDSFAEGKQYTCIDLAVKLEQFGSYASEKQQGFAAKLVEWSKPRKPAATDSLGDLMVPRLFSLMQRLADLHIAPFKISRKNQDSLCWVLHNDALVGKLEGGKLVIFFRKAEQAGVTPQAIRVWMSSIEQNPLEAAKAAGRASGRCAVCGRDLTEPGSIGAGIGPVCLSKFA